MKKIIKIQATLVLVIALFSSCLDDFRFGDNALDKPDGVEMTLDTIFSNAELARRHLWSLYWYTPTPIATFTSIDMNAEWYETMSDCFQTLNNWGYVFAHWYSGSFNATTWAGNNRWAYNRKSGGYEGIRIGWTFLENIDRVPDMSAREKGRLKAEAKVIIAGKYWEFFRHYGGVPIIKQAANPDDNPMTERATIEEMYNFMIELLDEAIAEPELPWMLPANEVDEWWGRVTKAAAYGQKMLVQLSAASPIFNSAVPYFKEGEMLKTAPDFNEKYVWWGGYKPELWQALRTTCEEFVRLNEAAGEPYRLNQARTATEQGYQTAYLDAYWNRGDFYSSTKGTYECVYVHLDSYQSQLGWWDRIFGPASGAWGTNTPTAEYMEMFCWADGKVFDPAPFLTPVSELPANWAPKDNPEVPASVKNRPPRADDYYMYENRDPRLYENLWVQKRGQWFSGEKNIELWPGGASYAGLLKAFTNGIGHRKWSLNYDANRPRERQYSWPILRMGAFHLIYAEALAETGNLAGACSEINKVRARVGIPGIETSNPELNLTSNKENLIKQILRERACELGLEDTRLMDMIRRKLKDDFTKPLHGVWTYRTDGKTGTLGDGEVYPQFWYVKKQMGPDIHGDMVVRSWQKPGGWSNRFYLTCFPQDEILKGYGLVQNPGW